MKRNHFTTILKGLFLLIFVGFLWYLFTHLVKPGDIYRLVKEFPHMSLALSLLIATIIWLLRSWRLQFLLARSGIAASYLSCLKVFVAGQAVAPLPGGEIARGALIQHETDCHSSQSFGPLVIHGLLEFMMAGFLVAIGSFVFDTMQGPAIIGLLCITLVTLFILYPEKTKPLFQRLNHISWLKNGLTKFSRIQEEMKKHLVKKDGTKPSPVLFGGLTNALAVNILGGLLIYIIAKAYGVDLGIMRSIFLYTSSIIVSSLAGIVPGGLGFTEGGMAGILVFSGIDLSTALAIVFVFRMVTLGYAIIVGLLFLISFYGKSLFVDGALFHAKTT